MRRTRRLPEGRSAAAIGLLASLAIFAALGWTTASCSRHDYVLGTFEPRDAAPEAADLRAEADADAGDAALVDGSPLPIVCATTPCAIALTTTMRSDSYDRAEGYCALLDDGTVACWGTNLGGQLGSGDPGVLDSQVGVRVPGLSGVVSIDHTCAVDDSGAAWCWGTGPFLQDEASTSTIEASPVRLPLPGAVEKIAVTPATACALLRDGSVVCWGANRSLQVAMDEPSRLSLPLRAIDIPAGVKDLVMGDAVFARYADGRVLSWGANPPIGRPTPFAPDGWPAPLALDRVAMLDSIDEQACAVTQGIGWCWGAAVPSSLLVRSDDPSARALPAAVATLEPITRIATSRTWIVRDDGSSRVEQRRWCATAVTGAVDCWGLNDNGQAGDGTKAYALEAVRVAGLPAPAADVKVMPHSTCALLTNGKVFCWGNNFYGQLGAGMPKGSSVVPMEVRLP